MTLITRIQENSNRLTEADRRIVAVLLDGQGEAAFLSAAQLAGRAQVHETTATRLAQKLGFDGYPALRAQLQQEFLRGQDAATRIRRTVSKVVDGGYLTNLVQGEIAALEGLLRSVSQEDVDRAADMILAARRIFIFAQGHAVSSALFLEKRLNRFGLATTLLTGRGKDIAERLVALGAKDLTIAFALRQEPVGYGPLMRHAAKAGARRLMISDLIGPTMAPKADLMFVAARGSSGGEFQTQNIPMTIVNAILLTIAGRHESRIVPKLEALVDLVKKFN